MFMSSNLSSMARSLSLFELLITHLLSSDSVMSQQACHETKVKTCIKEIKGMEKTMSSMSSSKVFLNLITPSVIIGRKIFLLQHLLKEVPCKRLHILNQSKNDSTIQIS